METLDEEESGDLATEPDVPQQVHFSERPSLLNSGSAKQRKSISHDLATGKEGGAREACIAQVRPEEECTPRKRRAGQYASRLTKVANAAREKFRRLRSSDLSEDEEESMQVSVRGRLMVQAHARSRRFSSDDSSADDDEDNGKKKRGPMTQYRLTAPKPRKTFWGRLLRCVGISAGETGIYDHAGGADEGCQCCGVRPNMLVINYLNWAFRNNVLLVVLSGAIGFFTLTLIFAGIILAIGRVRPNCVTVNGYYFKGKAADFADAYALSWTTFSTVGYGLVHPSTSATQRDANRSECAGIQTLCTLESFVGILFASFCGAVMFAKVSRIRSEAQIAFSDPVVVRYGQGVFVGDDDDRSSSTSGQGDLDQGVDNGRTRLRQLPPPVIEFRLMNRLHGVEGGELMDCSINMVASIDERQASPMVRNATRGRRRKGKRRSRQRGNLRGLMMSMQSRRFSHSSHPSIPEEEESKLEETEESSMTQSRRDSHHSFVSSLSVPDGMENQSFDEDPSGMLVPKRIFSKVEIETPDHPFFKRLWLVRHVLDQTSPLLTQEARRLLKQNRGFWPEDLNNFEGVRRSIKFDQLLVSMSGTSNADASSVYAQKVYDYVDMNVGYRFVNAMYRDHEGYLFVDPTMLNDITEQFGGGAEPFTRLTEDYRRSEILI